MRLGLSERVAIEAGIYRRDSLTKIAKDTGISRKSLSKEIRQNRTLAPAAKFNGKDCRFAAECTRQCVCGDFLCRQECVFCRKIDCRTLCPAYSPLSCMRIQSPPYVCNVCQLRRDCVCDRAYYVATQAHAVATDIVSLYRCRYARCWKSGSAPESLLSSKKKTEKGH